MGLWRRAVYPVGIHGIPIQRETFSPKLHSDLVSTPRVKLQQGLICDWSPFCSNLMHNLDWADIQHVQKAALTAWHRAVVHLAVSWLPLDLCLGYMMGQLASWWGMLSQSLVELPDSPGPLQQPVEVLDKGAITPHHQQSLWAVQKRTFSKRLSTVGATCTPAGLCITT